MANIKISQLPGATSPVSPSDVMPIVQSGITKKAAIDQLGFIASGSSAVTRAIQNKLRDAISVKDFGAVGNGSADDTDAIKFALDAVKSGGVLLFPPGVYRVTSAITKTFDNNAVVSIIGYGAKINGTSVTGGSAGNTILLKLGGARLSGVALGVDAAKYATSITTASAISASVNDIALISSTDLWNPTRPAYVKGEMIEMRSISGTAVGCHIGLFDSYTAATTTVYPLSMPTINIEGLEIEMNANQLALVIAYSRNPSIKHTKVYGARYTGISFQYCFGGTIDSNEVYDAWYSGSGTSYGVAISTCQNTVVSNNNLTEARHCITGGGWEPCRNVIYIGNVCTAHPLETNAAAIDQHGNMEFCSVLGNVANGGIEVSSINAKISDNTVMESRNVSQGILVYQEISSDFYEISNNSIICSESTTNGIRHVVTEVNLSVDRFFIHGNNIKSAYTACRITPATAAKTGCSINILSIKNNVFYSTSNAVQSFAYVSAGAASITTTFFDSSGNTYKTDLYDCFITNASITNLFSANDKFLSGRNNAYVAVFHGVDATIVNPYFDGNIGGAGNSRSVLYRSTGIVRCINPTFKNMTYKAELESGVTQYIENGWYAATPTIVNTVGAKLVNFYGTLGRATTYGTAAPTTNTWAVGDRVYNQAPAIGQPKSWVCTVAGTPGTWESEGNL